MKLVVDGGQMPISAIVLLLLALCGSLEGLSWQVGLHCTVDHVGLESGVEHAEALRLVEVSLAAAGLIALLEDVWVLNLQIRSYRRYRVVMLQLQV